MRQIERSIAQTKRELIGLDAIKDKDMFTAKSVYLRRQRDLYEEFAKLSGQPMQDWRHQVYSFDRSKAAKASGAYRKIENLSNKLYNSTKLNGYLADYKKSVGSGMISALVKPEDYINYKSKIDLELIGIEIKSQSKHFIERVFGTIEDPNTKRTRSGVEITEIKEALQNPVKINPIKTDSEGRRSQTYIGEKASVSINIDTQELIQCNPTSTMLLSRIQKEV